MRSYQQSSKRLSQLALLTSVMALPLSVQAALPEAIQTAMSQAGLTAADVSIVITPVGNKNTSHLPDVIQVIDSSEPDNQPTADTANNNDNNGNNDTGIDDDVSKSTLVTVEKRTVKEHEQRLHNNTDDAYTSQSLESIPTVLSDTQHPNTDHNLAADHDANQKSSNPPSNKGTNKTLTTASTTSTEHSFLPLLDHQSDIARTPASTMKLVPTFIALDTLGADFVWHTRVYHTGVVIGDQLHGDLIIQGSGDPKMTHERLKQLLYKVQASGIRHIDGDIIVDSSVFDGVSKDPAAFDNAPLRPYNASPDGFLVNFSTIAIKSYPLDNGQAQLTYTPGLADYHLPNTVSTRSVGCGQASYSLAPQWQKNQLVLNAALPDSCRAHTFYVAYPDAKDFTARVIASKWQELGNTLNGNIITQETPYGTTNRKKPPVALSALPMSPLPLVSYPSLDLTQQIYDINHFSNNVMTEQLALSIGSYAPTTDGIIAKVPTTDLDATSLYQFGKPATADYSSALQTIDHWWHNHLQTPAPHLTNGSGLCRDCTITAANLNELLTYAYHRPSFSAYVNSLGVAGVSGTITAHSSRLPESAAIGRAWIKTGTLNNVTSMAGYVKGLSGQDYVVVGLINKDEALNTYAARTVLDTMLDWTAQH
ncbi:MAG: D-alanyl-D-alanine carboxypeptidase/D-alanyl-D-alanine-endopeptidase [Psychrobacter sp.]|uniref:D-alanyl-D-alanine carboxypeptidase/D-alanyl-D-alanine-endopeptidase n=1 Tax=Psychrobacter sp. TaxID=56811 RepID=UPI003F95589A